MANQQRGVDFMDAVKKGDESMVKRMLEMDPNLVDCEEVVGFSPLRVALKLNNEELVKSLLQVVLEKDKQTEREDLKECLLYAIKSGLAVYVSMIITGMKANSSELQRDSNYMFKPCEHSTEFANYMTPLLLAAQCGNINIIHKLLSDGHPLIQKPHRPDCICTECVSSLVTVDALSRAASTYEIYRGLCNPKYILLSTTDDPFLRAFKLTNDLTKVAERDREFLNEYKSLIEDTKKFAADFVGECRNAEEIKLVLKATGPGCTRTDFEFPLLAVAVDLKQNYFVAHKLVQEVLRDAWLGDWYAWRSYSRLRRCLVFIGRVLMLPVVLGVCVFAPNTKWARYYSIPVNRMISFVASYLVFLTVLFCLSYKDKKDQTRYQIRSDIPWQIVISVYLLSFIVNTIRLCCLQGAQRFLSFKWNLYEITMEAIFVMTILFWLIAHITMDWQPDIERKYWHYLDPQLLAEGLFCVATVLAYMRILFLMQTLPNLGPFQASLGNMVDDFALFAVIFAVTILAFTVGMSHLYEYYDGMMHTDPETGDQSFQVSSFVSMMDTFRFLFYGLFNMAPLSGSEVVIENLPSAGGELQEVNTHDFTQLVGTWLFGIYTLLTSIVLINMLIAAITNTFMRIIANADIEWMFGRTEVWLAFMSQTVLPPPLSLLPTLVGTRATCKFFRFLFSKCSYGYGPLCDAEQAEDETSPEYRDLLVKLERRYLTKFQEVEDSYGEGSDRFSFTRIKRSSNAKRKSSGKISIPKRKMPYGE